MSNVGFQAYRLFGSRFYLQRDPVGSKKFPLIDLGTVEPISPNVEATTVQLKDSDGGRLREVDSAVTEVNESSQASLSNLNMDNASLLWMADAPSAYTQAAGGAISPTTTVFPGRLFGILDANGDPVVGLYTIAGIYSAAATIVTATNISAIDATTKTITFTGGSDPALSDGEKFILTGTGLDDPLNAGTYTADGASTGSGPWTVVVEESFNSSDTVTGNAGEYKTASSGTIYDNGTDWEVANAVRGLGRIKSGGAISDDDGVDVVIVYTKKAITGKRIIYPQDLKGEIRGYARINWSAEGNAQQVLRYGRVALSPAGATFSATDFSKMALNIRFLSDLTKAKPAGLVVAYEGDLPTDIS